jgi:hypothetical protein
VIKASTFLMLLALGLQSTGPGQLPSFPLGTVLVWKSENRGYTSEFVIRLARFKPDLYFEWESASTQGTILIKKNAVEEARKYSSSRLMQAGAEIETADETTYWLSRALFRDLKSKAKVSWNLDAIKSDLSLTGKSEQILLVNQKPLRVSVLEARDNRGGIWGFLDDEDNPLLVMRRVNSFQENLASINTDRPGSLRWIVGKRARSGLPQ